MKTTRDAIFEALHTLDGHYRTLITEQALLEEEAMKLAANQKEIGSTAIDERLIDITRRHFIVLNELYPIMYFAKELGDDAKKWIEYYEKRMKQAQELGAIKACDSKPEECSNMHCMHVLSTGKL